MARVSLSKCTTNCLQIFCVFLLLYCVKRNQLVQENGKEETISQKRVLKMCLIPNYNKSLLGEDGLDAFLSDEDKIVFKKEISKGYRDFAFNEFVSKDISVGKSYISVNLKLSVCAQRENCQIQGTAFAFFRLSNCRSFLTLLVLE